MRRVSWLMAALPGVRGFSRANPPADRIRTGPRRRRRQSGRCQTVARHRRWRVRNRRRRPFRYVPRDIRTEDRRRYLGGTCLPEEIGSRNQDAEPRNRPDSGPDQALTEGSAMKMKANEDELVRGSGDVFADLGFADASLMRLKSRIATEITRVLDRREFPLRGAARDAGATAADLSRTLNSDLGR